MLTSTIANQASASEYATTVRFEPAPDDYDWIQLTSDEWLKGELISLYDNELVFESDALGALSLDWEDVRHFRGSQNHRISIQGFTTMAGKLQIDDGQIRLETDDDTREFSRQSLIAITPAAYRELDNWGADATFGTNIRKGNAETIEYNLLAGMERRTPRSRINLDYLGNFNETDGEQLANNHRVNGTWDLFSGNQFFWRPIISQFYRDPFQNISRQGTLETGIGYEFIDTQRTEWQFSGGLGGNFIRYQSVEPGESDTETSPALSLGTHFETEITPWLDYLFLLQTIFLDDDSGAYQHHLLTTLSTDLIGNFDLDISFIWDRIGKPQQRADGTTPEKDDYRLMIGVGYDF
jgi:hypothetical protein